MTKLTERGRHRGLSLQEVAQLSRQIGVGWQQLGVLMGFPLGRLQQMQVLTLRPSRKCLVRSFTFNYIIIKHMNHCALGKDSGALRVTVMNFIHNLLSLCYQGGNRWIIVSPCKILDSAPSTVTLD